MPLLVHCSDDGMMTVLLAPYSGFLQNVLNICEIKSPPTFDIIFFGNPFSEKKYFTCHLRLLAGRSSVFLMT